MGRVRLRRLALLGAICLLTVGIAACDPIENAPPGGGEVVQGTFRIGPFNLAPDGQPGSESNSTRSNVPKPSGAFGLKTISFDIVDAAGTPRCTSTTCC
jgi:hypothetical protein